MTVLKNSESEIFDVEDQKIEDECADTHCPNPATVPFPKMTKNSEGEIYDVENQKIEDECADTQYPNSMSRIKQMIEDFCNIRIHLLVVAAKSPSSGGSGRSDDYVEASNADEFIEHDRGTLFHLTMIVALPLLAMLYGVLYLTGHRFVEQREKFAEIYRMYSRSHFTIGLEFIVLLSVYQIYGPAAQNSKTFLLLSISMWFLFISWIYAPFLFNPSGLDYFEVVKDWNDWIEWMRTPGYIVSSANLSWESWWDEQQGQLHCAGFFGRLWKIILSLRFFVYGYLVMYMLHVTNNDQSMIGYCLSWSWLVIVASMIIFKIVSTGMEKLFNVDLRGTCLLFQMFMLYVIAFFIWFIPYLSLTVGDVFSCLIAFLLTGWALLEIAQACRPFVEGLGMWEIVKAFSKGYELLMGTLIFLPLEVLALILIISEPNSSHF